MSTEEKPAPSVEAIAYATDCIDLERNRQVEVENWDADHDDTHQDGSLWQAACFYAHVAMRSPTWAYANFKKWPWAAEFFNPWKKKPDGKYSTEIDQERCLIKAGALILAEQDRLDRALQNIITKLAEVQEENKKNVP